jgi:hypothetical protein
MYFTYFYMPRCNTHTGIALVKVAFPTALQQGVTASLGDHDHRLVAKCSKNRPMEAMHLGGQTKRVSLEPPKK